MEEKTNEEEIQLPPVDFETFVRDLITTAHLYLHGFRDPETEKVIVNLGLAKRMIDTLEMLEQKTKGNLSAPESNFLANSLYELRMGYIRAANNQKAAPESDKSDETSLEETASENNTPPEAEQTNQVTKEEENTFS